ncbi:TolB-like 6-bladed beta-propeller domain-containing protein [Bacteroides sp. OttesenSCG-928-F21]|nr:TolB-like 6-bladed beta-propeller domain-containing protein [Bacteroides sp. OttesenSCG-928-F21]
MKRFPFYFIFGIIFGCSTNSSDRMEVSNVKFDLQKEISYKIIETDFLFSYPVSLSLTENELIVQDEKGHDNFFHVLNRNSGTLVSEFGKRGNGPGEILYPTYSPLIHKDEFQVYDYNKNMIFYYKKENNLFVFSHIKKVEKKEIDSRSFIRQSLGIDNLYVTMGENGIYQDNQIVILDEESKVLGKFVDYPILTNDNKKEEHARKERFNIFFLEVSPDMSYIVIGSYKMGIMDILSLEKIPDNVNRINCLLLTPLYTQENENIYGFEDIYLTNNYIYTLHNGMSAEENPLFAKSIKVFDKYGNPIIQYNTNLDMRCIAVDEKHKKAFAISYREGEEFFLVELNDIFIHLD